MGFAGMLQRANAVTNVIAAAAITLLMSGAAAAQAIPVFHWENFGSPDTPHGWEYSHFSRQPTRGIDNSACLRANIYGSDSSVGAVITEWIDMGDVPVLSYWHRITNFTNDPVDPVASAANTFRYTVSVTADGENWTVVYTGGGGTDNPHTPSLDYAQVSPDVSAYANQICRIRMEYERLDGDIYVRIDDVVMGTRAADPVFSGLRAIAAGSAYNAAPGALTAANTYTFRNDGESPMEVSLDSKSDELTLDGLEISLPLQAGETRVVTVTFNAQGLPAEDYSGSFTLATSDPENPSVTVAVTAKVADHRPISEGFEDADMPPGWEYNRFTRRMIEEGVDSTACIGVNIRERFSYSTATVTTRWVGIEEGDYLSYKYIVTNASGDTAAAGGDFRYAVWITADDENWTVVHSGGSGTDNPHTPSLDYERVIIAPEALSAYAGRICRIRIEYERTGGDIIVFIDDVTTGADIVSVLSGVREIADAAGDGRAVITRPASAPFEFTAGPNPVRRADGVVNFYAAGKPFAGSVLTVYDAAGNVVRRIAIRDDAVGNNNGMNPLAGRRVVGAWDLKDANGRPVSNGAYMARGVIKTSGGKHENVLLMIGLQ